MNLTDQHHRPMKSLRLSVTDRCNLRCAYCMPTDACGRQFRFIPHEDILRFEESFRLARILLELGVRKIRLTGGEPLVRRGLPQLVKLLAGLNGLEDLALTTNGTLLAEQAMPLKEAGLHRLTLSLDAVDPETYRRMSGTEHGPDRVLHGLQSALRAGFGPIKLNCVVRRGWNERSVTDLVEYFRGSGQILRFIEYMDVGQSQEWNAEEVVPEEEILSNIQARWPLEALPASKESEVARRYRLLDGSLELGLITSVSHPFCGSCDRLRLSSDGHLYPCLFAETRLDLRTPLRGGATDEELRGLIYGFWSQRGDRYSELRCHDSRHSSGMRPDMHKIGG